MTSNKPVGLPANGSAGKPGPRHARPRRKVDIDLVGIIVAVALLVAAGVWDLKGAPVPDRLIGPARAKATTTLSSPAPRTPAAATEVAVEAAHVSPQGSTQPHARPTPRRRQAAPQRQLAPKATTRRAPQPARSTIPPAPTPMPSTTDLAPPVPGDAVAEATSPTSSLLGRLLNLLRRRR